MLRFRLVTKHELRLPELAVKTSDRIKPRMMQLRGPQEAQQPQVRKKKRNKRKSIPT